MKYAKIIILYALFSAFLVTCQAKNLVSTEINRDPLITETPEPISRKTDDIHVQKTSMVNSLQMTSTSTEQPTAISTQHVDDPSQTHLESIPTQIQYPEGATWVTENCVQIVSALGTVSGQNLILQFGEEDSNEITIIRLEKPDDRIIVGETGREIVVSPDHRLFAYIDKNIDKLKIMDRNGNIVLSKDVPETWTGIIQWVDETKLIVENYLGPLEVPLAASVLYDIDTDRYEPLPYDWRGIYSFGAVGYWNHHGFTAAVFNPQLSFVVYLAEFDPQSSYSASLAEFRLVLYDLRNAKEIMRVGVVDVSYASEPQWLQNGQAFITSLAQNDTWEPLLSSETADGFPYAGGTDLYKVSVDGTIRRVTYLSVENRVTQDAFSLSSLEGFVSYWENENPDAPYGDPVIRQLSIANLQSGKVEKLCLYSDFPAKPVWSPDDKYLAVQAKNPDTNLSQVLVIDLQTMEGAFLPYQMFPTGWLIGKE